MNHLIAQPAPAFSVSGVSPEGEIKTYTFKNAEEMEAFKYGVCESNNWLNYKIIDEEIEVA